MTPSPAQYERITTDDVEAGDRIARTRSAAFHLVAAIDEAPATRRFHFAREDCTEPEPKVAPGGKGTYCPGCNRWYLKDSSLAISQSGHGQMGGGNIRPRRTAKLWRMRKAEYAVLLAGKSGEQDTEVGVVIARDPREAAGIAREQGIVTDDQPFMVEREGAVSR